MYCLLSKIKHCNRAVYSIALIICNCFTTSHFLQCSFNQSVEFGKSVLANYTENHIVYDGIQTMIPSSQRKHG